ncbi:PLAC8-domain-containing protein [Annulohypoxylon stygium]|nr:PLAC8-domain-containing protein [Annulohypoxylon stygium]
MSIQEKTGGDWQNSLCNCSPCGSCILGTFAPCLLVGRTSSRLRDPTDPSPEYFNGDCIIHGGLTLIFSGWIFSMMKRTEIRERFGIPGSGCGDCCAAFWCQCCQVIQADNEINSRLIAGPIQQGYQPQNEGMRMPNH